jgi:hypothetical protein
MSKRDCVYFSYERAADFDGYRLVVGAGEWYVSQYTLAMTAKELEVGKTELLEKLENHLNHSLGVIEKFDGEWKEIKQ